MVWNDFHSNVSNSFKSLRNKEDFSDVTLIGDDFKPVAAHKIILSSCSKYFNNTLKNIFSQKHPVLCLEGLSFQDIEKVMDYIYNGELKIYQDDIDRFLDVGQRLGLEGLVGMTDSPKESHIKENYEVQDIKQFAETNEIKTKSNIKRIHNAVPNDEGFLVSTLGRKPQSNDQHKVSFANGSSIDSIEELDKKVEESYTRDTDGTYSCSYCQKLFKKAGHVREHVELHFDGLIVNCNYCEKTFRSRNNLRQHVKRCITN